ncbi:Na+/H+ antiporter [Plectosphaerella cucumerina]|uniref:Na+/H+ antiporter n=1 Tax=Plectosphaerella cucumerina TaxID=40658 RepID=A0A8K0X2G9_9PEZI|nr:Na+/H+ antiporter [Plectosphaerella cucumerina]
MAWDHLSITNAHLVYIILGGFTSLFMLCSTIIKERMYIGEATVATLCGIIFGPQAANLINPATWGNVDLITIEFSRIVLVVQCFAVGVELPKFYMERHWRSVTILLIPVMTFGWLITSLFVWWMVPTLDWLESLVVAACVTATDPVLASSVVGKGKFAKRVPKHLRDLLSAESGCNDGMAFPFVYLGIYLIQEHMKAKETVFHWFVYTILYECIFGAIFGFSIGYIARHAIKFAERRDLIDRESFLVFYFVLALFCAGSGSLLGMDDLLIGFAAGVGFSNDGWFHAKTEESHVSNVIDLLINLAYFVYLGTIIPWDQFNNAAVGLTAWRLVVLAIFVILFRRIPIMLALKPFIPDIKTWREALFAGHFGPIGVGAIFIAILARAELAYETAVPLSEPPPTDIPHYDLILLIWPITTFIVIASIVVHGSSIAVFTLGKRINTLQLTMSYTTSPDDGPTWMNRLPRLSSQSKSQARSETSDDLQMPEFPPGTLPPTGIPGQFLRRQREAETSSRPSIRSFSRERRRHKSRERGLGGPVSQSAIFPARRASTEPIPRAELERAMNEKEQSPDDASRTAVESGSDMHDEKAAERRPTPPLQSDIQIYDEGGDIVIENQDDDVIVLRRSESRGRQTAEATKAAAVEAVSAAKNESSWSSFKRVVGDAYTSELQKRKAKSHEERKHEPARAYQFGNTIVIEDEDGEVIKTYELPVQKPEKEGPDLLQQCQKYLGIPVAKTNSKTQESSAERPAAEGESSEAGPSRPAYRGWTSFLGGKGEPAQKDKGPATNLVDDKQVRFTIGREGRRMNKDDFLREVQNLDPKARREAIETATMPEAVKKKELRKAAAQAPAAAPVPEIREHRASDEVEEREPAKPVAPVMAPPAAVARLSRTEEGDNETPAERRRREAALGSSGANDDDSDDEGGERVPPSRRGIRFADNVGQRRE